MRSAKWSNGSSGQPINIFIPSPRMRNLFLDWLNADNHEDLILKVDDARQERFNQRLANEKAALIETQTDNWLLA